MSKHSPTWFISKGEVLFCFCLQAEPCRCPGLPPLSSNQPSKARPRGKTDASRSRDSRPMSKELAARGCSALPTHHGALFITRAQDQEASREENELGKTDGVLAPLYQSLLSAMNNLPFLPYFPPHGLTSMAPPGTEASRTACSGDWAGSWHGARQIASHSAVPQCTSNSQAQRDPTGCRP